MDHYLLNNDLDIYDDDLEVLDFITFGFPRRIYDRTDHFNNMDQLNFFRRFRLTKETVLHLLNLIQNQLEFPHDRNNSISPINQLLTTLRFYSTGGHLLSVADFCGMHVATTSRIVARVTRAIASLYKNVVKFPTSPDEIAMTQNAFYNIARFPRVIGALDCTHIKVQSWGGPDAEIYRNRKQFFSINVQAICNANLEFTNVVARWPGSCHDVTIFNNSRIRTKFERGNYRNCLLLGDSGYNVRPYLMTPLNQPNNRSEQLFNESHIRTRNAIERCFGVWKRRFPVLAYGCRVKQETLLNIIIACSVLHNIARQMGEEEPPLPAEIQEHELQQLINTGHVPVIPSDGVIQRNIGFQYRQNLINNFFTQIQNM